MSGNDKPSILVSGSAKGLMALYVDFLNRAGFAAQELERLDHWELFAQRTAPRAVLIGTQKLNGEYQICEKIRSKPGLAAIPIVLLSRSDFSADDQRLFETLKVRLLPFNEAKISEVVDILKAAAAA